MRKLQILPVKKIISFRSILGKLSLIFVNRFFLFIVAASFLLTGCKNPFIKEKYAGLTITTNPQTTVFLNGENIGKTPFSDEKLKPGDYTLKLTPEGEDSDFFSWQDMIKLSPGILTIINRSFSISEEESSGYTLALEPTPQKDKVSMFVISSPDRAIVNVDGEPKGFTPISLDSLSEGDHRITISLVGYEEEVIKAKAYKGYKLTLNVQLAIEGETEGEEEVKEASASAEQESKETSSSPSPEPSDKKKISSPKPSSSLKPSQEPVELEKPYVKIKETETGWLRVREKPTTSSKELTQIHPGEIYKFIEKTDNGWYKIEYEEDEEGWISGKYATLYE